LEQKNESLEAYLEKTALNKIKRLLHETAGLNCSGYREEYLKRRFEIRLKATGNISYGKYLIYLKRNPSEFDNLLNDLTVNYTTFFRDADVYQYIENTLFPMLFRSKTPVRIWSAGCASGEEPYSLAILVHRLLGKSVGNPSVTIYASDIDKDALSKASLGRYQAKQLGAMNPSLVEQFFTFDGEAYIVKDFVKRIVHFQQFDLMKPSIHQNLDLILCRNVMIYFAKESQQQIHMSFFKSLKEGGYFITGKSEILSGEPAQRFVPVDHLVRLYQRLDKKPENKDNRPTVA
jgi:chemotaxis protein methyltransferase CheR